jgi:hypothetical protein
MVHVLRSRWAPLVVHLLRSRSALAGLPLRFAALHVLLVPRRLVDSLYVSGGRLRREASGPRIKCESTWPWAKLVRS